MSFENNDKTISSVNNVSLLRSEDYDRLKKELPEADAVSRSELASQLVMFVNQESKELLFLLARDDDPVVKAQAYDSLSVFYFSDVEAFLINAIENETDCLARSYALLSLADIAYALYQDRSQYEKRFLSYLKRERSPQCVLSSLRALYMMGDESRLSGILSFLSHEDYHIRCFAISALQDILTFENKAAIMEALHAALKREKSRAVILRIESFVNQEKS